MNKEFERNLEKYAEVIIKVGLNLQPGQRLVIAAPPMVLPNLSCARANGRLRCRCRVSTAWRK